MRSKEVAQQIEEALQWFEGQKGRWFTAFEQLCSLGEHYDRHFTTVVQFSFCLESVMVRFSGARLMLMGPESDYEIGADYLYRVEKLPDGYAFYEKLPEKWTRLSTVTLTAEPQKNGRPVKAIH